MTVSLLPRQALPDVLCCVGLGFMIAAGYDLMRLFVGKSRPVVFFLDILSFLAAAVLLCGFAASQSAAGISRWYLCGSVMVGAIGYSKVLSPMTAEIAFWIRWLIGFPLAMAKIPFVKLKSIIKKQFLKEFARWKQFKAKRRKNRLKKAQNVMYNSNM